MAQVQRLGTLGFAVVAAFLCVGLAAQAGDPGGQPSAAPAEQAHAPDIAPPADTPPPTNALGQTKD